MSSSALRPVEGRPRVSALRRRQRAAAYAFVAPFVVVFLGALVLPLAYSGYLSLFQVRLVGGEVYSGLANYAAVAGDAAFWRGLLRMLVFLLVQTPVMLGLALFLALALDSGRARGAGVLRLLFFVPYAVPAVVATLMWGYLYGRDFGPIDQVTRALGLPAADLLAPDRILGSMMNIVTWEFAGYNMIIMYAALRAIPPELYEAAELDGASQWRIAWSIKIPSIAPAILLTAIFSVIGVFQLFNEPSLLKTVAPNAISSSYTPNYYAYTLAFVNQDVNYAAAVAFVLGFVIMVASYAVQLGGRRRGAAS